MNLELQIHSSVSNSLTVRTPRTIRIGETEYAEGSRNRDHSNLVNGYVLWTSLLIDGIAIVGCSHSIGACAVGRLKPIVQNMPENLTEVLRDTDDLADTLVKFMTEQREFKASVFSSYLRQWLPVTTTLVAVRGYLIGLARHVNDAPSFLRWCRSVSTFFKKIEVDRPDLDATEEHSFVEFERKLSLALKERVENPDYLNLCDRLHRLLISKHSCKLSHDPIPRHGSGVVSTRLSTPTQYGKYMDMKVDGRIEYLLRKRGLSTLDYNPFATPGVDRTNQYATVPKNWKKKRTISYEPIALQYFQQGIRDDLYYHLERDEWWSKRVKFSDQSRSRELARISSLSGSYATIDLSSASDSVTLDLVKRIFGNTELARWLIATRSTGTRCTTETIEDVKKFAPMGSALCFPVQTMVFILISELAIRDSMLDCDIYHNCIVYGDDIIVPSFATDKLVEYLTLLGFSVNTEKSFSVGWFREACGMEAWAGHDVTPIRYKRLFESGYINGTSDPLCFEDVSRVINLTNSLEFLGAHSSSRIVLAAALSRNVRAKRSRLSGSSCFKFSDEVRSAEFGYVVSFTHATNFNLKTRFKMTARDGNAYQTRECRVIQWSKSPTKETKKFLVDHSNAIDTIQYLEWLIRHTIRPEVPSETIGNQAQPKPDKFKLIDLGYTMIPTFKWSVLEPRFKDRCHIR